MSNVITFIYRNPEYVYKHPTGIIQSIRDSNTVVRAMRQFVQRHKSNGTYFCRWCGRPPSIGRPIHCHHIIPVWANPSLAADRGNMMLLCSKDHLAVGHCGHWKWANEEVKACCAVRKLIKPQVAANEHDE